MQGTTSQIAIIIITYNRPEDMLELAQNISRLKQLTALNSEVIIVNNKSTVPYTALEDFISKNSNLPFRYFMADENLGVSGGRNFALQKSSAPILIFLDDDAFFQQEDALVKTLEIFNSSDPGDNRAVGIVSYKVLYHSTGQLQQNAFPHKRFNRYKQLHHFQTSYFAGGANAMRREVLDKTGNFPGNFFYGMEEYDLSYRVLNAGYSIVYDDRVTVLHKESPHGRLHNRKKLQSLWINKSKVAWKYLPAVYFFTTSVLWSFQYLYKGGFPVGGWFKGWFEIMRIPGKEKRKVITRDTLRYLEKVKARLWY